MPPEQAKWKYEVRELDTIKLEEGVRELWESPEMAPYCRYMEAVVMGQPVETAKNAIADLPLEKRYLWRVVSALKWAFADLDEESIEVDRCTLSDEQRLRIWELLRHRPLQFCLFLRTLVGTKNMKEIMLGAIQVAESLGAGPTREAK